MSEPFLGEIRTFGFNFAPIGWATCDGQILAISQNTALFSLLGTFYGGNGTSTFALPDLRGRHALHQGQGPGLSSYVLGQVAGVENVTLNVSQMPQHNHSIVAQNGGSNSSSPSGAFLGNAGLNASDQYFQTTASTPTTMAAAMVSIAGGSLPFSVLNPYLCMNLCIALQGIFPSRN